MEASEAWWKTRGGVPRGLTRREFAEATASSAAAAARLKGVEEGVCVDADTDVLRLEFRKIILRSSAVTTEDIFWPCFGSESEDYFWLDSADTSKGRFSFMGGRGGTMWRRVQYKLHVAAKAVTARAAMMTSPRVEDGKLSWRVGGESLRLKRNRAELTTTNREGHTETFHPEKGFVDWLDREMRRRKLSAEDAQLLPFDFQGGFVGYLGYEMRDECDSLPPKYASPLPDAAFFLADRLVVFDHHTRDVYVVGVYYENDDAERSATKEWISEMSQKIESLTPTAAETNSAGDRFRAANSSQLLTETGFSWRRSHDEYVRDIECSQEAIRDGQTYEVCLTNMLHRNRGESTHSVPPLSCRARDLYHELRRSNPAPYAALLSFAPIHSSSDPLVVCCCSPERFMRHSADGVLEAKPIKGTAARVEPLGCDADVRAAKHLEESVKDRAENLMIVDLLRNDLSRVCRVGSITVPALMKIESYATVHQLVSTVRGQRRRKVSQMDVLRATYPGGSMTGAPKIRTMEIIDALETGPRMVYSGSIGFFSFSSAFDLNIVIRSVVLQGDDAWIGAGGAITILSDPQGEWEEIELKSNAILRAVARVESSHR